MDSFFGSPDKTPEARPQTRRVAASRAPKVRIIPLGGLGEIGMNMIVVEYGNDLFVIDCGQMFPDDELLGVDMVIPDLSYVVDNRHRFRAILLTHGHEDHIGGLPYLLSQVRVPIYGSQLTLEIVREKLKEWDLDTPTEFKPVCAGVVVSIAGIEVEFIHVTHSIPEARAIAIRLPFGNIIFTGDYKIDPTPIDGHPFDYQAFARYGEEGVLALFADSTNVEREGNSGSEREVIEPIDRLIRDAPRSILFSCFASSLHRVQVLLNLAEKHGRTVFVTGLNMVRNIRIAAEVGAIKVPDNLLGDIREMRHVPPEKRIILTTGSQAEPLSALSRMALDSHKDVKIVSGDTVILSSRIIPGNEKKIYRMINHFFRRGAEVFYDGIRDVHVSGHAHRGEMRTMIALTRPKYLIPVHGEFRHLVEHKHLGLEMDADGAARGDKIEVSRILVDGHEIGEVDDVVLRDRKHLSEDGMVIVMLVIEESSGELVTGPDIVSRGFLYMDENEAFFDACKRVTLAAFEDSDKESKEEWGVVKATVRRALKKYIKQETGRFPVILPVVLEI
jgi:ribonuclease J